MNSKELELGATFTNDFSTQCGVLVDESNNLQYAKSKQGGFAVYQEEGVEDAAYVCHGSIARAVAITITSNAAANDVLSISVDGKVASIKAAASDTPTTSAGNLVTALTALGLLASNSAGVITLYTYNGASVGVSKSGTQAIAITTDTPATDTMKPLGFVRRNTLGIEKADGDGVEIITRGKIAVEVADGETSTCGKTAYVDGGMYAATTGVWAVGKFVTNPIAGVAVVEVNL